jgi:hypothetical protein
MKKLLFFTFFCSLFIFNKISFAQDVTDVPKNDKDWRIEIEPSGFVLHGYSLQVTRNVTKDNRLNVGLYTTALNVPDWAKQGMFNHLSKDADVRLGFELAFVAHYKIKLGQKESNPYIGFIGGWEYFDISQEAVSNIRISAINLTPYIGYEIYFFKQMVYINPQLRGVFYVAPDSNTPARAESMKSVFLLPTISLGVKL